jgi:hypothetical protein
MSGEVIACTCVAPYCSRPATVGPAKNHGGPIYWYEVRCSSGAHRTLIDATRYAEIVKEQGLPPPPPAPPSSRVWVDPITGQVRTF